MNRYVTAALAASMLFGLSGCATVLNGTHQKFQVKSDPAGAKVRFTNGESCTTPCSIELKRKEDSRADFTLADFVSTYVLIQSKLAGSTFGNVILGGVVGGVVDASNGASNRLAPQPLNVRLAAVGSGEEAKLLDKKGKVQSTVKEYNDKVKVDVAKTIGSKLAGIEDDTSD